MFQSLDPSKDLTYYLDFSKLHLLLGSKRPFGSDLTQTLPVKDEVLNEHEKVHDYIPTA